MKQLFKYRDKINGNTYILKINHGARAYEWPANVGASAIHDAIPVRKKDIYSMIADCESAGYNPHISIGGAKHEK